MPGAPKSGAATPPEVRARILVVEDDEGLREIMVNLVEAMGYSVLSAGSSREALELFEQHGGAVELLLADVVMPGMDGTELAVCLRERRPGLKVLYVSGYPDALSSRGLQSTESLLLKPFGTAALVERVRELLRPAVAGTAGRSV